MYGPSSPFISAGLIPQRLRTEPKQHGLCSYLLTRRAFERPPFQTSYCGSAYLAKKA